MKKEKNFPIPALSLKSAGVISTHEVISDKHIVLTHLESQQHVAQKEYNEKYTKKLNAQKKYDFDQSNLTKSLDALSDAYAHAPPLKTSASWEKWVMIAVNPAETLKFLYDTYHDWTTPKLNPSSNPSLRETLKAQLVEGQEALAGHKSLLDETSQALSDTLLVENDPLLIKALLEEDSVKADYEQKLHAVDTWADVITFAQDALKYLDQRNASLVTLTKANSEYAKAKIDLAEATQALEAEKAKIFLEDALEHLDEPASLERHHPPSQIAGKENGGSFESPANPPIDLNLHLEVQDYGGENF